MLKESNGAVIFAVKVLPRASRNQLVAIEGDIIKIRLTAPPVEGKANQALIRFLAELLSVSRSQVEILTGEKSKQKIVRVRGVTAQQVETKIAR